VTGARAEAEHTIPEGPDSLHKPGGGGG